MASFRERGTTIYQVLVDGKPVYETMVKIKADEKAEALKKENKKAFVVATSR